MLLDLGFPSYEVRRSAQGWLVELTTTEREERLRTIMKTKNKEEVNEKTGGSEFSSVILAMIILF